jgi:hypothetical protein
MLQKVSCSNTVIVTFFFISCKKFPSIPDDFDTSFPYVFSMSILTEFTSGSQWVSHKEQPKLK